VRLIVTGGGTGGHVYPALEVARYAVSQGWEVAYFGSVRGMESRAAQVAGIPFHGFRSSPLGRPWSPAGLRSLLGMLRSSSQAKVAIRHWQPNAVFSTGGYAAAPVLNAARSLGIPIVIHEQNSVPGRTNRLASRFAKAVCVVFEETCRYFPDKATVTGMPLRRELLEAAAGSPVRVPGQGERFLTLALGGSQGSAALNEAVLTLATHVGTDAEEWLQVCGPSQFESCARALQRIAPPPHFKQKPFLEVNELVEAYRRADLAITRAGTGVLCELSLFGIPGIFVPYPYAHADHQLHNAEAIAKLGGGTVLPQSELTPERLTTAWRHWRENEEGRRNASEALRGWVIRNATARIWNIITEVAR
jgi:UDP-N-acetylglucosamine--N-acetylmuramyl-(pentapeptide) pyrophosphoryl-undecaprenol N-acetylglucosamine transferase